MAGPINTVGAPPGLPIADLETLIAQQEEVLGPLVAISNDGSQNLLTFDLERDPPETHPVIAVGERVPNPAAIATGKIFVSGRLVDASALRR